MQPVHQLVFGQMGNKCHVNNLDVVDDAFEYLMSKAQKGEKGQYFTPRYVIDMCVKMMNPTIHDKIIDTACGSSGFTVHSIFKVWKEIRLSKGLEPGEWKCINMLIVY